MTITIEHLTKRYGAHTVLRDFSAALQEGSVSVLMGPSGCGKTTLLRMLMGFEQPDSGALHGLEGVRISATFQEDRLCAGISAVANLSLVSERPRWELETELAAFGLDGKAAHAPVQTLSGGEARRVAILRCMEAPSELLLLDEPLRGLDRATREAVLCAIKERRNGRTMLWVTHDAADAEFWQVEPLRLDGAQLA
ncbi:MAG: ATP-binding cassette domain-containing protein [Pygmaiobacter sp.]